MLTLFSVPKPFVGEVAVLQENAIGSWTRLGADCEVILFGDEAGIAQAASRFATRYVPEISRNASGTPILSDVVARAEKIASHPILCFVNADMILFDDIVSTARAVAAQRSKFLVVASRFNLRIHEPLTFGPNWPHDFRARAENEGRMYPAGGSDIFIYPRGLFGDIPPFAIGRGYWDNWLMLRARERGAALIDATGAVVAVHQEHDYNHIVDPARGAADEAAVFSSPEGKRNLELAGGRGRLYTLYDATAALTAGGALVSTARPSLIWRRVKAWLRRSLASWKRPLA